jgi:xylulokinase
MSTILAIDLGSSRIKAGYLDQAGSFTLAYSAAAPVAHPEPGAAIQEPGRVVQICVEALACCAEAATAPESIVLTGQMGGAMVVDRDGAALTPWLINMDNRCQDAASRLQSEVGDRIRLLAASMPEQAQYLRWLRESDLLPAGSGLAFLLAPYVATQLAGEGLGAAYCDRTCLGWSGLADVVAQRWDDELVRAARWRPEDLPAIVEPGTVVGHLASHIAGLTGLPAGLPIVAGPGDQAGSLYALGATTPGDVVDGATTFPLLMGVADHFFVPRNPYVEVMPGVDPGIWHPLGFMLGTGAMPAWYAQDITGSTLQDIEVEAEAAGTSTGVLALPYGVPGAGREMRGVFWGLDASVRKGHLHYALLEGMAFEYALLADALSSEGVALGTPVLSYGGGSASRLLSRLKAAALERPLRCLGELETTLAGAALCAAHRGGWAVRLDLPESQLVEAEAGLTQSCRARLREYRRWREAMLRVNESLSRDGPDNGT